MAGRHQIDVVYSPVPQPQQQLPQLGYGQLPSPAAAADLMVLAEHAAQGASAKEYRAAAPNAADAGLLPVVGRGTADQKTRRRAAAAGLSGPPAHTAAPGTEHTRIPV